STPGRRQAPSGTTSVLSRRFSLRGIDSCSREGSHRSGGARRSCRKWRELPKILSLDPMPVPEREIQEHPELDATPWRRRLPEHLSQRRLVEVFIDLLVQELGLRDGLQA